MQMLTLEANTFSQLLSWNFIVQVNE
jgi:hypothetical protein